MKTTTMKTTKITLIAAEKEHYVLPKWKIVDAMRRQQSSEDLRDGDSKREMINVACGDLLGRLKSIWRKDSLGVISIGLAVISIGLAIPPYFREVSYIPPRSIERVGPGLLKCPTLEEYPTLNPVPHKERESDPHPHSEMDMHHNPPTAYAKGGFGVSMGGKSENQT